MGFYFALAEADGSMSVGTETLISPHPTRVEYPESPAGTILEGSRIHQQPAEDLRIRAWEWLGYPGWFQRYQDLWNQLEPLRSRYRRSLGLSPYVYLKEDETQELALITPVNATSTTRTFPYWKCRVVDVSRQIRKDGGLVKYDVTRMAFVIEDESWNYLG